MNEHEEASAANVAQSAVAAEPEAQKDVTGQPEKDAATDTAIQETQETQETEEEQTEEAPAPKPKKNLKRLFLALYGIALFCAQPLIIIFYLFGMVTIFNDPITPIALYRLVEGVFDYYSAQGYELIIGFLFAIFYLVLLGFMIKEFVVSCKWIRHVRHPKPDLQWKTVCYLHDGLSHMFFFDACFCIVMASLFDRTYFSALAVAACAIAGVLCAAKPMASILTAEKPKFSCEWLFKVIKSALVVTICCLLVALLNKPAFRDLLRGFYVLFNGNINFTNGFFSFLYLLYWNIIEPILYIVLLAMVLRAISVYFFTSSSVLQKNVRSILTRSIIFAAIMLALHLFFGVLIGFFSAYGAEDLSFSIVGEWFYLVKENYFPIFCLTLAWIIIWIVGGKPMQTKQKAPAREGAKAA